MGVGKVSVKIAGLGISMLLATFLYTSELIAPVMAEDPVGGARTAVSEKADAAYVDPYVHKDKKPWPQVSSYTCYYGPFTEALLSCDVAIVEPKQLKPEDIARLNAHGVYSISYITLGEDSQLRIGDGKGPGGYASYYMDDGIGFPATHPVWGSRFVDPGNPLWQEMVLAEAQQILAQGYDGLFLDTIDACDRYPQTKDGMVALIKKLRETFPEKKIIANRGFGLLDRFYQEIDGVMFECFSSGYDFQKGSYILMDEARVQDNIRISKQTILPARAQHFFHVFALDYGPSGQIDLQQMFAERVAEYGFISFYTTISLDQIYLESIPGM